MQRGSLITTLLMFLSGWGRMAPVGQEAMVVGISHRWRSFSCMTLGAVRWIPRMAMSEQCTAPHMLRQQARAILTWAGSLWLPKYSNRSSITALTVPAASVAGVWQCTQPWVWTMLLTEWPVAPMGMPIFLTASFKPAILL